MKPTNLALSMYKGDTYQWSFVLWSDADKTQAIDLTGVTAKAEIRDKPGGNLITAMDCEIQVPNVITMTLAAAASNLLKSGSWDLQLTFSNGVVATVLAGKVSVTVDVTDSVVGVVAPALRSQHA